MNDCPPFDRRWKGQSSKGSGGGCLNPFSTGENSLDTSGFPGHRTRISKMCLERPGSHHRALPFGGRELCVSKDGCCNKSRCPFLELLLRAGPQGGLPEPYLISTSSPKGASLTPLTHPVEPLTPSALEIFFRACHRPPSSGKSVFMVPFCTD